MSTRPLALAACCALLAACSGAERRADPVRDTPPSIPADAGATQAVQEPAPDAGWNLPRGCDINLSGRYRLEGRSPREYVIEDDGERLIAKPAGEPEGSDGVAAVLERGPGGLVGSIVGSAKSPSGEVCPVSFPAQIVSCSARALVIRSEEGLLLEDGCGMKRLSQQVRERVLLRD